MQTPIFEMLTWQAAPHIDDNDMISAMARFSGVVKTLPGFLYQSLYKKADHKWVCIYFWETEQEAHASNEAVAGTPEFSHLMSLIKENSLTMEVFSALQSSGVIRFA